VNSKKYSLSLTSNDRPLVSVQNLEIPTGEITFLLGESGIGKSLLSKAVYGILDPDELSITVNHQPYLSYCRTSWVQTIQKNSFFVFQEPSSHLNPLMTIKGQIREGGLGRDRRIEDDVLHRLWIDSSQKDIDKILTVYPKPYRPSGGEKQRFLLTMAFKKIFAFTKSMESEHETFFVFDEPTGSLDNLYRNRFLTFLFECYRQKRFTIWIITHDYSIISEIHKKHYDIFNHIHFKELRKVDKHKVQISMFSPTHYLSWLRESHHLFQSQKREEIFHFHPECEIFKRRLVLYAEKEKKHPAPLVIHRGEMVYVKAPSGMGKTTLAKVIMGLYHADWFKFSLMGTRYTHQTAHSQWRKNIWGSQAGMVFQHADEALNLESTVRETFGGLKKKKASHAVDIRKHCEELFGTLHDEFLSKKVKFLSGGQKQRLNLLRTFYLQTDLVILDEPLNGLDFESIKKVLAILSQKMTEGAAFLLISHNEEIFDELVPEENIYYLG